MREGEEGLRGEKSCARSARAPSALSHSDLCTLLNNRSCGVKGPPHPDPGVVPGVGMDNVAEEGESERGRGVVAGASVLKVQVFI